MTKQQERLLIEALSGLASSIQYITDKPYPGSRESYAAEALIEAPSAVAKLRETFFGSLHEENER